MLDVLHYMFEEDMHVRSAEEVTSISKSREIIYKDLYGKDYKYSVTVTNNSTVRSRNSGEYLTASGEDLYPDDGFFENDDQDEYESYIENNKVKDYFPPTEFNEDKLNPFGSVIDPPLN